MLNILPSNPRKFVKSMSSAFPFWLAAVMIIIALCQGSAQAMASRLQEEVMTNQTIIDLVKANTSDSVIISLIQHSKTKFDTSPSAVLKLKQAGVSDAVIQAMMNASSTPSSQPTPSTPTKGTKESTASGSPLPEEVGVYWQNREGKLVKLDLRMLGQSKVGGRLGSVITLGIKSVKYKAYILEPKSKFRIQQTQPTFYIRVPEGTSIDEYVLVEMDQKSDRRELEVASVGGVVGGKQGLRFEKIRAADSEQVAPNVFKVVPRAPLRPGEYLFYIIGSADHIKGILGRGYDLAIDREPGMS